MHVLLIEPDRLLSSAYTRAIELAGFSVDHALSAMTAVQQADNRRPDAVIMELQLPGQNGVAFLQEFRTYDDWLNIPVIFHTYVSPSGRGEVKDILSRDYGVVAWLHKPSTSLDHLTATLKSYLTERS